MEIILAAALLPAIILMIYVYKQDTVEKEPIEPIARLIWFWYAFLYSGQHFGGSLYWLS